MNTDPVDEGAAAQLVASLRTWLAAEGYRIEVAWSEPERAVRVGTLKFPETRLREPAGRDACLREARASIAGWKQTWDDPERRAALAASSRETLEAYFGAVSPARSAGPDSADPSVWAFRLAAWGLAAGFFAPQLGSVGSVAANAAAVLGILLGLWLALMGWLLGSLIDARRPSSVLGVLGAIVGAYVAYRVTRSGHPYGDNFMLSVDAYAMVSAPWGATCGGLIGYAVGRVLDGRPRRGAG